MWIEKFQGNLRLTWKQKLFDWKLWYTLLCRLWICGAITAVNLLGLLAENINHFQYSNKFRKKFMSTYFKFGHNLTKFVSIFTYRILLSIASFFPCFLYNHISFNGICKQHEIMEIMYGNLFRWSEKFSLH